MPVFQSKNEKFHKYTEIKQNKPVVDGQEIFVKWVSPQVSKASKQSPLSPLQMCISCWGDVWFQAQPCHAHQALEDAGPSYVTPLLTQEEKEKNKWVSLCLSNGFSKISERCFLLSLNNRKVFHFELEFTSQIFISLFQWEWLCFWVQYKLIIRGWQL